MNKKYLFGMLLSGAMLAACTADDDLKSASVAQDVNPSAPVFTVSFEDGDLQNRAEWNDDNAFVKFQENVDKLSLFHGMTVPSSRKVTALPSLAGWQNAIYTGTVTDDVMTYSTAAMVNPGLALLVYPGDTNFQNAFADGTHEGAAAPNITISLNQDEDTKKLTPYMSEFIDLAINPGSDQTHGAAGYDNKYDVALKKVGSNLRLRLTLKEFTEKNISNLGIADIKIKKVELVNHQPNKYYLDREVDGLFTYSVPVAVSVDLNNTSSDNVKRPAAWVNKKDHQTWYAASDVDLASAKGKDVISTSDVTEKDEYVECYFTMLPFRGAVQTDGSIKWEAFTNTDPLRGVNANDVELIAYTNYGKVSMNSGVHEGEKIWYGKNGDTSRDEMKSITDGLAGIADLLYADAQNEGTFKCNGQVEKVGARITRYVDVDLNRLDMDGLHVENEQELMDAIKLYTTLYPSANKPAVFYLDGDDKNVFEMSNGTWAAVNALYEASKSQVVCLPCGDAGEVCTTIRLKNKNNSAEEIPSLKLGANENNAKLGTGTGNLNQKHMATILLEEGEWTYTDVTKKEEAKQYAGVYKIEIGAKAKVTIDNLVMADVTGDVLEGGIVNNGEITVANEATIAINTLNKGKMYVNSGKTLRMSKATLINNASTTNNATGLTTTNRGEIYNTGEIYCNAEEEGYIYNYGYIEHGDADAVTLISKNSTAETDTSFDNISKTFANIKIGTIDMLETPSEFVGVEADYKGFIKLHITENNPTDAVIGSVANYIVVEGGCTEITSANLDKKDKDAPTYWASAARYLEVNTDKRLTMRGDFVLQGLVIATGHQAYLVTDATLRVGLNKSGTNGSQVWTNSGCFYLKGSLIGSGKVTYKDYATFEGYFGGNATDKGNIGLPAGNQN